MARQLTLLPKSALVRTSPVDHPDWNYRPILGFVQRLRFRIILELLGESRFDRMLEIGYGSGVFMPELAQRCAELHGIDPHSHLPEVERNLARNDVKATLTQGTAEEMPYDTGYFDCAVTVSALEYVPDISSACAEIRRILKPNGTLVLVTPGATPLWDLALRLSTGESPAQYADRRQKLQPALHEQFTPTGEIRVPRLGLRATRLYTGLRLRPT